MFQSKVYASGKWASGTHDEERREGGLLYVKMASIQEEIEEEARTPPSPPSHKAAEAWSTRRKYGCVDNARRTKDLLDAEAYLGDEYEKATCSHPQGGGGVACDLGSAGLVLRASGSLPQEEGGGLGLQRTSVGARNYALFLQTMEERSGYGWSDSQSTVNFPSYYLERQDSGLSIISTISELAEDPDELDELDAFSEDEDEVEDGGEASESSKLEGEEETGDLPAEESAPNEVQMTRKCKKKISFWDGPDQKREQQTSSMVSLEKKKLTLLTKMMSRHFFLFSFRLKIIILQL